MRSNAYQNYLEDEILTAEPLKLVVLLYQGALDSVASARLQLTSGSLPQRSKSIGKALKIVAELNGSLDMVRGGEVSAQLALLYDYVQRRLIESDRSLNDQPLAEVEQLLSTLLEGWRQCASPEASAASPGARQYGQPVEECASVNYAW